MPDDVRTTIGAEIDATDQRLRALGERLRSRPDQHLLEGDWTVRDTLCHLAARANDVPLVMGLASRPADAGPPPAIEMDVVNARQIAEREGRSVDELLAEAAAGYAAARAAVAGLSREQLAYEIPDVLGRGPMTTADLLVLVYRGHAQEHIAAIERALAAA